MGKRMFILATQHQTAPGYSFVATGCIVVSVAFVGATIGFFGISLPVILITGAVVALGSLALRADLLLGIAIVFAFVIAGVVRYFAATNAVANVAPMLLILLIVKAIFEDRSWQGKRVICDGQKANSRPVLYLSLLFFAFVILSAFNHSTTSLALILALKTYLPMAGLLLIVITSRNVQESVYRLWTLLLAIAVIQLPFVVYQHFFIAGARSQGGQGPSWDSIVGTMGGNPDGGGSSGALAIFLSLCLIYVTNLVRYRLLGVFWGILFGILIVAGIALAEVKIVFVLLPLGVAGIFWNEVKREPTKAFLILALGILGTACILLVYQAVFWEKSKLLGSNIGYNFQRSFEYMLDPNYFHATTGEVGRFAGFLLWWKDAWTDPLTAVFGNGPGASRLNNLYVGDVARRYFPFTVDSTALVAILWDFGVVGFTCYACTLLAAFRIGVRHLNGNSSPTESACIHTAIIGIAFLALSSIYNKDILYLPQMSLLLTFCIATTLTSSRTQPR